MLSSEIKKPIVKVTKLEKINKVAVMLNFLNNDKTFSVLQVLCESDGLYVSDITIKSRLVQTEVSAILSKLKKYNLVSCTRYGKHKKYIINADKFEHLCITIKNYLNNNL